VKTYYNERKSESNRKRGGGKEGRREGGEGKEGKGTASVPFLVEPLQT
jgi:hypothetical protein